MSALSLPIVVGPSSITPSTMLSNYGEVLSNALLRAVAAAAQCNYSEFTPDSTKRDAQLSLPIESAFGASNTEVSVQLKHRRLAELPQTETLNYRVDGDLYRRIASSSPMLPLLLVVAVVPDDPNGWIRCRGRCVQIRHRLLWAGPSLFDRSWRAPSKKSKKTVKIPLRQTLSPLELLQLFYRVSKGERL